MNQTAHWLESKLASLTTASLVAGVLLVLAGTGGCASRAPVDVRDATNSGSADPPFGGLAGFSTLGELSPFQWAVWSGATLFFIAEGSGANRSVYGAEAAGEAILESMPPRITVVLLHSRERRIVPLHELLAPQELDAGSWRLQCRDGERWVDQPNHQFVGDGFLLERGGRVPLSDLARIRFVPRT